VSRLRPRVEGAEAEAQQEMRIDRMREAEKGQQEALHQKPQQATPPPAPLPPPLPAACYEIPGGAAGWETAGGSGVGPVGTVSTPVSSGADIGSAGIDLEKEAELMKRAFKVIATAGQAVEMAAQAASAIAGAVAQPPPLPASAPSPLPPAVLVCEDHPLNLLLVQARERLLRPSHNAASMPTPVLTNESQQVMAAGIVLKHTNAPLY
jgi:hypothetical protein